MLRGWVGGGQGRHRHKRGWKPSESFYNWTALPCQLLGPPDNRGESEKTWVPWASFFAFCLARHRSPLHLAHPRPQAGLSLQRSSFWGPNSDTLKKESSFVQKVSSHGAAPSLSPWCPSHASSLWLSIPQPPLRSLLDFSLVTQF